MKIEKEERWEIKWNCRNNRLKWSGLAAADAPQMHHTIQCAVAVNRRRQLCHCIYRIIHYYLFFYLVLLIYSFVFCFTILFCYLFFVCLFSLHYVRFHLDLSYFFFLRISHTIFESDQSTVNVSYKINGIRLLKLIFNLEHTWIPDLGWLLYINSRFDIQDTTNSWWWWWFLCFLPTFISSP